MGTPGRLADRRGRSDADMDGLTGDGTAAPACGKSVRHGAPGAAAPFRSDAPVFVGSPAELAEQLELWAQYGLDGFRLRPAAVPHDLDAVTGQLLPRLLELGLFRHDYTADTLRGHLGLDRPANRYAAHTSAATTATATTTSAPATAAA